MNLLRYYLSKPKEVRIVYDEKTNLYCCRYLNLGVDWNDENIRMARGIVLDSRGNIVSKGYDKFFNYLELQNQEDIENKNMSDWNHGEEYVVTEKIDGSYVLVTYHNNDFVISSSSSITNEYTELFKTKLESLGLLSSDTKKGAFFKNLATSYCIVMEYVSPQSQIVLPYEEEDIILHGIIEKKTWKNLFIEEKEMYEICYKLDLKYKKYYDYTLEELIEKQKSEEGIEGWVVQFKSGKMLKFKTDWYFENHNTLDFFFGNVRTERKIKNVIDWFNEGTIDDYIAMANQRLMKDYAEFLNQTITRIKEVNDNFDDSLWIAQKNIEKGMSSKEYAKTHNPKTLDSQLFFAIKNNKEYKIETMKSKYMESELIKLIKNEENNEIQKGGNRLATMHIMVGIPASGKSHHSKVLKDGYEKDILYLSSDEIRKELFDDEDFQGDNNIVFETMNKRAKEALQSGIDVIYDATNISRKRRKGLMAQMPKGTIFVVHYVHTTISEALKRNRERERKVSVEAIKRMYKRMEIPILNEGFSEIEVVLDYDYPDFLSTKIPSQHELLREFESPKLEHDELMDLLFSLYGRFIDMYDLPHDSTYHPFSVSRHTYYVYKAMTESKYGHDVDMLVASLLHDIGKPFTKTFVNYKGDTKKYAGYYGHEFVSSQMVYDFWKSFPYFDRDLVSTLCQFHMRLHDPNCKVEELKKLVGEDIYDRLVVLNECDKLGK